MGSHKVVGPSNSKHYVANSGCFRLHIAHNVATSIPSLTSQSCGDSLPTVCLARQIGAITDHSS